MVGSHVAEAVQVAGSFMAVLSFGIVLDLPKKYLGWSGVTGGVCWLVYLLIREETGSLILPHFCPACLLHCWGISWPGYSERLCLFS